MHNRCSLDLRQDRTGWYNKTTRCPEDSGGLLYRKEIPDVTRRHRLHTAEGQLRRSVTQGGAASPPLTLGDGVESNRKLRIMHNYQTTQASGSRIPTRFHSRAMWWWSLAEQVSLDLAETADRPGRQNIVRPIGTIRHGAGVHWIGARAARRLKGRLVPPAATAATAAGTFFARPGFVDSHRSTGNPLKIQAFDGSLARFVVGHLYKGEPFGTAGFPIFDDAHRRHLAKLLKMPFGCHLRWLHRTDYRRKCSLGRTSTAGEKSPSEPINKAGRCKFEVPSGAADGRRTQESQTQARLCVFSLQKSKGSGVQPDHRMPRPDRPTAGSPQPHPASP